MTPAVALLLAAVALGSGTGPAPVAGPEVGVRAGGGVSATVDRLEDGAVLVVRASGFDPHAAGTVAQCRLVLSGRTGCTNRFPVQFDGNGEARFQYLVGARVGGAACGALDPACAVVVTGQGRAAVALTVFGGAAPQPPRVTVTPRSDLAAGDVVTVRVAGLPRGTEASAAQCVSGSRCRATATAVAGQDGVAVMRITIQEGEAAAVRVTAGAAVAPVAAALSLASGPTAEYDPTRLAVGLAVAALLLLAAWALVRTTDWRAPREAATPELDHAVLDS